MFVVDVSALTSRGFVGTTRYEGGRVELYFDDEDAGVFLSQGMAERLHVKRESLLYVVVEGGTNLIAEARVASVGNALRVSIASVYYAVGREGGAIIHVRSGQG